MEQFSAQDVIVSTDPKEERVSRIVVEYGAKDENEVELGVAYPASGSAEARFVRAYSQLHLIGASAAPAVRRPAKKPVKKAVAPAPVAAPVREDKTLKLREALAAKRRALYEEPTLAEAAEAIVEQSEREVVTVGAPSAAAEALAAREAEIEDIEKALASKAQALLSSEDALAEREKAIAAREARLAQMERKLGVSAKALFAGEDALAEKEKALAESEAELARIEDALAERAEKLFADEDALAEKTRAYDESAAELSRVEKELAERTDALLKSEDAMMLREGSVSDKERTLAAGEEELRQRSEAAETREKLLAEKEAALNAMEAELDSIEAALAEKTKELFANQDALDERARALDERERAIAEKEAALNAKEAALAEKALAIEEIERELAERERALRDSEGALAEEKKAAAENAAELSRVEDALAEKTQALFDSQDALAEKESALAGKEAALAEKEKALAEKEAALAEREASLLARLEAEESEAEAAVEEEVLDPFGNLRSRTFAEKRDSLTDEMRARYDAFDAFMDTYEPIRVVEGKKYRTYKSGRLPIAKLAIRGKTLSIYMALDPKEYAESKYVFTDESESAAFEKYPMRLRMSSDRQARWARELAGELMEKNGVKKKPEPVEEPVEVPAAEEAVLDPFAAFRSRPQKTFRQKLRAGSKVLRARYKAVRAHIETLDRVRVIEGNKAETFRSGNTPIAKLAVKGKTLNAYIALPPSEYENSKYVFTDASDVKAYARYPMRVKLTSDRQEKWTKELIDEVARREDIKKKQ